MHRSSGSVRTARGIAGRVIPISRHLLHRGRTPANTGERVLMESIAGRYEFTERISSGGMGTVWRGYDAVLDREVAVKLIRRDMLTSPEQAEQFAKRFRREARVTARIRHHGVPQVY